jgi:cysteinyl-tRNA synthetase
VLRLYDTATASVRPLELRRPGRVAMYVCGPTVYDLPHLGHGRFALVFDILRRYLEWSGLSVEHVSNVTDIDDKIIERAAREGRTEREVACEYESAWWSAMDRLGVRRPTQVPHATDYVRHMVELIEELVRRNAAYETEEGVYMSVSSVPGYGLLKHQDLDTLRAGERVEPSEHKRDPLDFALWKRAKPGEPTWPSPFGEGRPGWHTECVVMSLELLGEDFDLHGGALDLVFPHHENERAQAVALGRRFARHWVHNGWVTVEGEKMSKSLGNVRSLPDLLDRFDPRAYRLLVLRSHYRSPIEVTTETLIDAQEGLERLDALVRRLGSPQRPRSRRDELEDEGGVLAEAAVEFARRMDDDLDTPGAIAYLYELTRLAHAEADAGHDQRSRQLAHAVSWLAAALGLDIAGSETAVDPRIEALVRERDEARRAKQWARADELRAEIQRRGWIVEDLATGTRVRPARGRQQAASQPT